MSSIWTPEVLALVKQLGLIPFPEQLFAKLKRNTPYPMQAIYERFKNPKPDAEGELWQVLPEDLEYDRFEKLCLQWQAEGLIEVDLKNKAIFKGRGHKNP